MSGEFKQELIDILIRFHQSSCYPKALDFEVDDAADLIIELFEEMKD